MTTPPTRPAGHTPSLVLLDVNETLSDLGPMADRFAELGAPAGTDREWFAATLRDGFALSLAGERPTFAELARQAGRTLLEPHTHDADGAADEVLAAFRGLDVHDDVVEAVGLLRRLDLPLVTLGNGAASVADALLDRAGVRDAFERLLSVEDAGQPWKPAAAAYRYAAETMSVPAAECMLVAAHPWDVDGARRAGLRTAWVNRKGTTYPTTFAAPDIEAESLVDLAAQLGAVGA